MNSPGTIGLVILLALIGLAIFRFIERCAEASRRKIIAENRRKAETARLIREHVERERAAKSMAQARAAHIARMQAARPPSWQLALALPPRPTESQIAQAYKAAARKFHPDMGGSNELMAGVNRARDEAMKHMGYSK